MSLLQPHYSTCGDNSFEVSKAIVQAKFLSGRYRTDKLLGHFNYTNGNCSLCSTGVPGSLEHLLVLCPALDKCRQNQFESLKHKPISDTAKAIILEASQGSVFEFVQVLLDCSSVPTVIKARHEFGNNILNEIFRFSRTWCYNIHITRMKMIGRWKSNV